MAAFARQLRGKTEMSRNTMGGVTARLIFPTPAKAGKPERDRISLEHIRN